MNPKCIQGQDAAIDPNAETNPFARGTDVTTEGVTANNIDEDSQFFGLRVCTENSSGRMVSIQFYLKHDPFDPNEAP